jgi:predicted nuclease with TOPRIM domain
MNIREKVEQTIENNEELRKQPEYKELQEFYTEMKNEGAVLEPAYTLPLVDTIGRQYYQDVNNKFRQR